jgi:tRNA A37 threonylcarbamoyladenosine synthetase subunit TsaC/SUA5/YrdC
VPNNALVQALLNEVGNPILAISAKMGDDGYYPVEEIIEFFGNQVDLTVTCEEYNFEGDSTVIDLTKPEYEIIRKGAGADKLESMLFNA